MKALAFEKKYAKGITGIKTFKNKLGEKYKIYNISNITICIAGDETDWEVLPIFNPQFNIWSKDELNKLGVALQELTEDE